LLDKKPGAKAPNPNPENNSKKLHFSLALRGDLRNTPLSCDGNAAHTTPENSAMRKLTVKKTTNGWAYIITERGQQIERESGFPSEVAAQIAGERIWRFLFH
jgi:hypothetical protein